MFNFLKKDKILKSNVKNFDEEKLYENIDKIKAYDDNCDIYEGLSSDEIEVKNKIISQDLLVEIPNDYKLLLKKTNGIYFSNGVKFLNADEILKKTKKFKEAMGDWEIGKIANPFLNIIHYHDGHGFVFWYGEINKYVIVDYIIDYELDDIESLKTVDNICEVMEYLKIIIK